MMPFGQFNSVLISVSENYPLTKVITYQFAGTTPAAVMTSRAASLVMKSKKA